MADTTEARRIADELAADVAGLLREGLPQEALRAEAAQGMLRALADRCDALEACAIKYLDYLGIANRTTALRLDLADPEMVGTDLAKAMDGFQ